MAAARQEPVTSTPWTPNPSALTLSPTPWTPNPLAFTLTLTTWTHTLATLKALIKNIPKKQVEDYAEIIQVRFG